MKKTLVPLNVRISKTLKEDLKAFCKDNGIILQFTVEGILKDFLAQKKFEKKRLIEAEEATLEKDELYQKLGLLKSD